MRRHVTLALKDLSPELGQQADSTHERVMRWLETDGTWADLYSITGELAIGDLPVTSSHADEALDLVKQASYLDNNRLPR